MPFGNTPVLTIGNESQLVREAKAIVQRVYEYVVASGRTVSAREIITSLPDASRSSITFALTRLVREGDLKRVGYGRYAVTGDSDPTVRSADDDEYLFGIFEAIRPVLSFRDLAFLYEVMEQSRRLIPEAFRGARMRSDVRSSQAKD